VEKDLPFSLIFSLDEAAVVASSIEVFSSSLKASTLLQAQKNPTSATTPEQACQAALTLEKIQSRYDAAVFGLAVKGGQVSSLVTPVRVLLRATLALKECVVALQEGVRQDLPLFEAILQVLKESRYVREASEVVLVREGCEEATGTHIAVLHGAPCHTVRGLFSAALGDVAAEQTLPDGWFYVSLRRAEGYGRIEGL